jgi:superoxide dismutase, Fe-Mn family
MAQPKPLSRRQVLQTASVLGIGALGMVGSSTASAAETFPFAKESGLLTGKLKPLKFEAIPGLLTKAQVTPHYQAHYGGALKRLVTIEENLDKLHAGKEPIGGDAFTLMQKDRVNRMNSVLLHELYFDGLTPKPGIPREDIRMALSRRFGSFDRWVEDFKASCMVANGWGILARDVVNSKLYNVASDLHEVGVIWLGQPLVVCDVYEHAFYVDYLNRKQDYVNKFVEFLDWDEINNRWVALDA